MAADLLRHAENVILILVLVTALGTLAGAWFSARSELVMVWLLLVATASSGISAVLTLLLLPMVKGFHGLAILDTALCLVVVIGVVKVWVVALAQVEFR
jgi:hypothetical protein